jgi:hypothetical protein
MGCTQYLDLDSEHRSLGLSQSGLASGARTDPFILPLSLDSSSLLSLSSLYYTEHRFTALYGPPRDKIKL